MKPDQVRERMEMYGLGRGEREKDIFLREVCDAYEDIFYKLVEKEDKVNALNDAVRYYKNMEDNIAQMLSTISEISEKTEKTAEKTAELTIKEAEGKAGMILADASQEAAQILEDAKAEAKEIVDGAEGRIEDSKKELEQVKEEINAYAQKFYEFLEIQKSFFEEHKIDIASLSIQPVQTIQQPVQILQRLPSQAVVQAMPIAAAIQPPMQTVLPQPQPILSEQSLQSVSLPEQKKSLAVPSEPTQSQPQPQQKAAPVIAEPSESSQAMPEQPEKEVTPVLVQPQAVAVPEEQAAIVQGKGLEDVTINQIRKIPNTSTQHHPTIEEIEARIPESIRNIPISDHTETLDEIIQSIKKSYEEVENRL